MSFLSPLSPRLVVALTLGVAVVSLVTARRDVSVRLDALRQAELERANREAVRLSTDLAPFVRSGDLVAVREVLERSIGRDGAIGAMVIDASNDQAIASAGLPPSLVERGRAAVREADGRPRSEHLTSFALDAQLSTHPVTHDGSVLGTLVLIRDATAITKSRWTFWEDAIVGVLLQVLAIATLTVLLVRWSLIAPLTRLARWMQDRRAGTTDQQAPPGINLFKPLAQEVVHLVSSLEVARASAREEARLRDDAESRWTAERLRAHVRKALAGRPVFVISNREPYVHTKAGGSLETLVPASGLVTALEPITIGSISGVGG